MTKEEMKEDIIEALGYLKDELKFLKSLESENVPEVDISIENIKITIHHLENAIK